MSLRDWPAMDGALGRILVATIVKWSIVSYVFGAIGLSLWIYLRTKNRELLLSLLADDGSLHREIVGTQAILFRAVWLARMAIVLSGTVLVFLMLVRFLASL